MTAATANRIDRTIEIGAPVERVWKALTTADQLSAWFRVSIEGPLTPGSHVWMKSTDPQYAGMRFQVRIVEADPPRRFVWEWHPGAVDPTVDYDREPWTRVTFVLEPAAGGTRVTLSETGFDQISLARRAKVFEDNSQGWAEVLQWLRAYAEKTR